MTFYSSVYEIIWDTMHNAIYAYKDCVDECGERDIIRSRKWAIETLGM